MKGIVKDWGGLGFGTVIMLLGLLSLVGAVTEASSSLRKLERQQKDVAQLMLLQERLTSNPANPPLFNWVCNLLIERRISRGLAARVLSQLHSDESAN